MMTGFAITAVPTGIVTYEIGREMRGQLRGNRRRCEECGWTDQAATAHDCPQCNTNLDED